MPIVTVYTAGPSCPPCNLTKLHLKRRGIPYTEVPIQDDGVMESINHLGFTSAPVVCASVDGEELSWDGYRPDRIDGLLCA